MLYVTETVVLVVLHRITSSHVYCDLIGGWEGVLIAKACPIRD